MNSIKKIFYYTVGPFWSAVRTIPPILNAPTYYPEARRKTRLRRFVDLMVYRLLHSCVNEFYNAYGCDRVGHSMAGYVDEIEFWQKIIPRNYPDKVNHAVILRDKYLFSIFMEAHSIPTPSVVAFSNEGRFYVRGQELSYDAWVTAIKELSSAVFVKAASSCCAYGVTKVEGGWPFGEEDFKTGKFIVQRKVFNCEEIDAIQPNSLNTLRIVTVYSPKTKSVELLSPGGLRVGGGGAVDNWAQGGLFVGIASSGVLQKYGYYKPGKHTPCKVDRQPQTGFVFEGAKIPFYEEAVALVLRAHTLLPEVFSIGWDVALTSEGPVLIEGNDDWEITLMQMVAGGLNEKMANQLTRR